MAGAKEIRTQIKSIQNTRKITKAMEMVSEGVSQTPLYLTQIPVVAGSALLWFALFSFTLKRLFHDR